MIRLIRLLIIVIGLPGLGFSQNSDVFNLENSRKFANYLFETRQFDLATVEFERVVFMAPKDSASILKLITAYRQEGKYKIGLNRAFDLLQEPTALSYSFIKEIYLFQSRAGLFKENIKLIQANEMISSEQKNQMVLSALMLDQNWQGASTFYASNPSKDTYYGTLGNLLDERNGLKRKSPYLASGFSMIVPGLGKIYTNEWADGLITLGFVATSAWQAYRGFKEDGIKSTYGWIFGSIGAGFYIGNIFGSFKSAKNYNNRIEKAYYDKVSGTVYNYF